MAQEYHKGLAYIAWERSSPEVCVPGALRVLIIDDSELFCRRIERIVNSLGHSVVAFASNGKEGAAKVLQHMPDVVIVDNHMPVADGKDCIESIRESGLNPWILVISGTLDSMTLCEYISLDVDAILAKPVNEQALEHVFEHFTDYNFKRS